VSLVQGDARNFGVTLAVACDMAFCTTDARFQYLEIEEGFAPTTAAAVLFPHVTPKALAYLMYGATEFSAARALSCGMVSDAFAPEDFAAATQAFVARLAGRPRSALQSLKMFTGQAEMLSPPMRTEFAISIRALASTAPRTDAEATRS
jgi:enoyl-CoA hydratase/carnithine racemase